MATPNSPINSNGVKANGVPMPSTMVNGNHNTLTISPQKQLPQHKLSHQVDSSISLDLLRTLLAGVNIRDLVPMLAARHVLQSYEMHKVYAKENPSAQVDELIEILRKKSFWRGPLVDSLIRNGKSAIAEQLMRGEIAVSAMKKSPSA